MKKYSRESANILLEAAEIQEKKGNDYNNAVSSVAQADYYPRGVWSILDIVHAKYLRMVSVLETMEQGGKVNFESVEDSAIDMINYTSFIAAYMRGEVPGQNPEHDVFNRPGQSNPALIPKKFNQLDRIREFNHKVTTLQDLTNQYFIIDELPSELTDYKFDELRNIINGWMEKQQ